jgi:hypothetical protein
MPIKPYMIVDVPSPIEAAMLLLKSGFKYDLALLNPYDNLSDYKSELSKRINLGIYFSDFALSVMFEKTDEATKYLKNIRSIGSEFENIDQIDNKYSVRIEKNIDNRDSIMHIIADVLMDAVDYKTFKEIGVLSYYSAFIEYSYIMSKTIINDTAGTKDLQNRLIDFRLTYSWIKELFDENNHDEAIKFVTKDLDEIINGFEKIQLQRKGPEVVEQDGRKVIKPYEPDFDYSQLEAVMELIIQLRTKYISLR